MILAFVLAAHVGEDVSVCVYLQVYECVCKCVCDREKDREREKERGSMYSKYLKYAFRFVQRGTHTVG